MPFPHTAANLTIVGSTLYLQVTGNTGPLGWAGGSGIWDVNDSPNAIWKDNRGTNTYYQERAIGDTVVFDNTVGLASGGTATLNANVAPVSITVNNPSGDYTISGSGAITGIASLSKSGVGKLTLSTANTYNGGTTINAGTLALSGSGTLGSSSSALTLNGGLLDLGTLGRTVGAVAVTTAPASGNTVQNGSLPGTSFAVSHTSGNAVIAANLLGTSAPLTMSGAGGTATLSGTNTYGSGTTISAGTLAVTGTLPPTGTVMVTGGTLDCTSATGSTPAVNLASGAAVIGANMTVTSARLSGGTMNFESTQSGNNLLTLTGGTVNFGSGVKFATTDFSYPGSGVANAINPVAVTSMLKLPDYNVATYTAGGSATAFSVGGSNIANDTQTGVGARTLKLNGGTLALSAPSHIPLLAPMGTCAFIVNNYYTFSPTANNLLAGLLPSTNTTINNNWTGTQTAAELTDGVVITNDTVHCFTLGAGSIRYTLPVSGSAVGYDITRVNIYSGWVDTGRENINLAAIRYSTVADPTNFIAIPLSAMNYEGGSRQEIVSAVGYGGVLASSVYAIQFDFGSQENAWVGYRELEVVGTPTASPPGPVNYGNTIVASAASSTLDLTASTNLIIRWVPWT